MTSFDEAWQRTYAQGRQLNKYPWSDVVSFVFRNKPDRPPAEVSILEVGCGSGPNLQFLAAEGFRAFGVDASAAAVGVATERLAARGLTAEVTVGDFAALPFADASMDLVIDRAALTHADAPAIARAVDEIGRVLKPGGAFLFTPFADSHAGFAQGKLDRNGTSTDIAATHLAGFQVTFFSHKDIAGLFGTGWRLVQCVRREEADLLDPANLFASWIVVARKS